jgi:hypothetical protein
MFFIRSCAMHHDTAAHSVKSVRAKKHPIEIHVGKLIKVLLAEKERQREERDLERVKALSVPSKERKRGMSGLKEKLFPQRISEKKDLTGTSPLTEEEFLKLPDVQAIIAIRGYDEHPLRPRQFAERITPVLADRNLTEKNLRDAIMLFIRMYPETLIHMRKPL